MKRELKKARGLATRQACAPTQEVVLQTEIQDNIGSRIEMTVEWGGEIFDNFSFSCEAEVLLLSLKLDNLKPLLSTHTTPRAMQWQYGLRLTLGWWFCATSGMSWCRSRALISDCIRDSQAMDGDMSASLTVARPLVGGTGKLLQ